VLELPESGDSYGHGFLPVERSFEAFEPFDRVAVELTAELRVCATPFAGDPPLLIASAWPMPTPLSRVPAASVVLNTIRRIGDVIR
jgi:hypothetical protein